MDDDAGTTREGLQPILYSIYFSCDPTTFNKVGVNQWFDSVTQHLYISTAEDVLCGPGVKVMMAASVRLQNPNGPPGYVVIILCPSVLTQTAGEPKMYADLAGTELSNTRPNFPGVRGQSLTQEDTLDLLAWDGMAIDQLRERVLSVYMMRVILYVAGAKFWEETHGKSKGSGAHSSRI